MNSQKFLIKIGGSLLFDNKGNINKELFLQLIEIIKGSKNISAIVCGGGIIARKYISLARSLNINESYLDLLGIDVSRINAKLFLAALKDKTYPVVVKNIEEALLGHASGKTIVAGGFIPGQSTTTVALEIAEVLDIDVIIVLTDVDGIYTKNPKIYPDAKKFDRITITELEKIIIDSSDSKQASAGEYRIFDAVSLQIFKRNNILLKIINGTKPSQLKDILEKGAEESKEGTLIYK
ncbi:MAG: UMP kinase [Promethearchaeota archaeon]